MANSTFKITGKVAIFPGKGGWHFIAVPQEFTEDTKHLADRGLVAIRATVGSTTWDTSLLPKGDQTTFIALPKKVRDSESIKLDDTISLTFELRQR